MIRQRASSCWPSISDSSATSSRSACVARSTWMPTATCVAGDRKRERGHEVDQPAEERPAFQEVVVALYERGRRLEPRERLDFPLAFGDEPAPDAGARGKPVGSVRL